MRKIFDEDGEGIEDIASESDEWDELDASFDLKLYQLAYIELE